MATQSKSILAKLLANENITVQHGNYQTAFFDVEKRVLGLPLWKDMSKSLTDLLIGHEVGHALFTPVDGWHDSTTEIPGCPRSYVNVVEDIRIEKKIQSKYPGLVRAFKMGYKDLFDKDFFGTNNREILSYSLVDRINIKAKLRDLVEVPFTQEEQPLVDMAMSVETWEDVLNTCRALFEYMKEQKENNNENSESNSSQNQDEYSEDQSEDLSMGSQPSSEENGEEDETPEELGSETINASGEPTVDDQEQEAGDISGNETSPETVETDDAFRGNEKQLLDQDEHGRQPLYVRSITRNQYKEMLFTYSDVQKSRKEHQNTHPVLIEEDYKSFLDETKRTTGLMAKEFEMRKAAYRTQRAQTARTGALDVSKLYSYKYNDDIFAKVTNLADAKSHGMIMMIDYSGSMDRILGDTIKQTLNLAMFCKKVNIPFEIYGFTSGDDCGRKYSPLNEGDVDHQDTRIFELLNSSMKKPVYEEAFKMLYLRSVDSPYYSCLSRVEAFGGTPLNEVLMATDFIVSDFRAKFPVQKVNFILLTDGDGRNVRVQHSWGAKYSYDMMIDKNGKLSKVSRRSVPCTTHLLNELRKQGVTTVGYRLAERNYDFNSAVWSTSNRFIDSDEMKSIRKVYNKQKFLSMDDTIGYDRYFVIKADRKSLDTDIDDLEIDANASKAQITKAFKKHASSKKGNRVLATRFAEIVA
jgi:hypothetical protein